MIFTMANTSVGFGIALIALGLAGYFGTGANSPTALIPAAAGLVLVVFGRLARNPKVRMHAMHGAALVGLLGLAGSAGGLPQLIKMMGGEVIARPAAAISRSIMAALCLAFVVLTVRSFVVARLARKTSPSAKAPEELAAPVETR
jgi:hypothetical protein